MTDRLTDNENYRMHLLIGIGNLHKIICRLLLKAAEKLTFLHSVTEILTDSRTDRKSELYSSFFTKKVCT